MWYAFSIKCLDSRVDANSCRGIWWWGWTAMSPFCRLAWWDFLCVGIEPFVTCLAESPSEPASPTPFRQRTYSVTGGHGVLFCNITSDSIRFAVTARPKVFCLCWRTPNAKRPWGAAVSWMSISASLRPWRVSPLWRCTMTLREVMKLHLVSFKMLWVCHSIARPPKRE